MDAIKKAGPTVIVIFGGSGDLSWRKLVPVSYTHLLHSTGQLHKGGPNSGLYIILIGGNKEKLPIPGEKYDFATLHQAQALGDFRSLDNKQRRVIYIDLGSDIDKGLNELKAFAVKTGATKN